MQRSERGIAQPCLTRMNICAVTREHVFGNEDFPLKECFHCVFYSVALIAFADRFRQGILQVQRNAADVVFASLFLFLPSVDQTSTFAHTSTRQTL